VEKELLVGPVLLFPTRKFFYNKKIINVFDRDKQIKTGNKFAQKNKKQVPNWIRVFAVFYYVALQRKFNIQDNNRNKLMSL
jgi:hypothetical protein